MQGLVADCRHALRLYAKAPLASAIAVIVLGVGIAFVVAFLSLYSDLILRPHPGFERSGRLSTIGSNNGTDMLGSPFEILERVADEMATIDAAATWSGSSVLIGPDREEALLGTLSKDFFGGLRPRLALGRGFRAADHAPDAPLVVVLSYRYWQQRFNGDPRVLGTFVDIERNPSHIYDTGASANSPEVEPEAPSGQFQIVGVMTQRLARVPSFVGGSFEPPMWAPLERVWPMFSGTTEALRRAPVMVLVRRAPDASSAAVANELCTRYVGSNSACQWAPGQRLDAIDGVVSNFAIQRDAKRQLEMFLAGSVLLALVAAANVSLFLLARAPGRRRELGMRMAVGAPTRRLARQLATEAGLLVIVSAVLGVGGSIWLSEYLRSLALLRNAQWGDVTLLDGRVLGLAAGIVLLLTVLVSLAPLLGLKRVGIGASSRQVTARASLGQRLAGTTQIAVAGTLGAAAIAFGWHIGALVLGDPGYEVGDRHLLAFGRITTMPSREPLSAQARSERAIVDRVRKRDVIEAIPGVRAIAFGDAVPGYERGTRPAAVPDPTNTSATIDVFTSLISREFIDVLGLTILHGRAPEPFEAGVALVNQALARALWGRDDVVGERLPANDPRWNREIVGVLEDLSFEHPAVAVKPRVFLPEDSNTSVVHTGLTAAELREAVDRLIADGAIEATILAVEPLAKLRNDLIAPDRARGFLTVTTAALVVLLAGFGFYGTQRFLVAAGRREYAVRAALGAGPAALRRLVFSRGLMLGLPGLAVGAALAFLVVAWLRDGVVSREVSPVGVAVAVVTSLVTLLLVASIAPAREARRTQTASQLREE